jgi:hypothetical protein
MRRQFHNWFTARTMQARPTDDALPNGVDAASSTMRTKKDAARKNAVRVSL